VVQLLSFNRVVYNDAKQLDRRLNEVIVTDSTLEMELATFKVRHAGLWGLDDQVQSDLFVDSVVVYSERLEARLGGATEVLKRAQEMFAAYGAHTDYSESVDILGQAWAQQMGSNGQPSVSLVVQTIRDSSRGSIAGTKRRSAIGHGSARLGPSTRLSSGGLRSSVT
jgi:hypothetical protein